jgi:hypothetical protein
VLFALVIVSVPGPSFFSAPLPLIVPVRVWFPVWLKMSSLALMMLPSYLWPLSTSEELPSVPETKSEPARRVVLPV